MNAVNHKTDNLLKQSSNYSTKTSVTEMNIKIDNSQTNRKRRPHRK